MLRLPFLEETTPPPFYQSQISSKTRTRLDRAFIGHRSQAYYLKRFAQFDAAGRLHPRWNWAAFFMTFGWLLYRKRYLDCVVYCVAGWSFIKVNIVLILAMAEYTLVGFLPESYQWGVRIAIALMVWLFWAAMVARWADAYYYRMARREIADVLEWYDDETSQTQHLAREGGVSLFGMSVAFAIFGLLLAVIVRQFVPLYVQQKQEQLLFDVYAQTHAVAKRVEVLLAKTGKCPTTLPVSNAYHRADIAVVDRVDGIKTDCAVQATVVDTPFLLSYLKGRTLTLYSLRPQAQDDAQKSNETQQISWRCQSSLNKKQTPKRCIG
ncbi:Protein of unknown function [Moraxella cuniculi DSM 21768]|uniref:DUF2628 domain-containing protein n=1 Tax=Moraxella cuniculi DSM 21768 TaxID=1122245 RepID=A0A1N7F6M7_9GAMM|nr:DUF2628 domain-containing protein [Moraxella cuniculi]OOS06430.1 hypothetical protein B0189_04955 [Moraxella cuniculi]SIR96027.1 Protein of unknown function [Moraxella cuniculi DSM 21768]